MSQILQMKELNKQLKAASKAYYEDDNEIMSNFEYDRLYDELVALEEETGIVLSDSITQRVGYEVLSGLEKVEHENKALSLAKTKSIEELSSWTDGKDVCVSWKLDGLTVILIYDNGELIQAATRGDGLVGENITEQARRFANVPLKIPYEDRLIVRGEALISYKEFERINSLTDEGAKFKNPRNLASGTVKSLDLSVFNKRNVSFIAFTLVEPEKKSDSYSEDLDWLSELGFDVVEHYRTNGDLEEKIAMFTENVKNGYIYPVDGIVCYIDNKNTFETLGESTHHPNYAMAFKWQDETQKTIISEIEWSKSRTGRINPVAIFDPVELEGTTVTRASLHNLTYIEDMKLNIGDEVSVYKANMIIPQIADNFTKSLTSLDEIVPVVCPICGRETKIINENGSKFLICENEECGGNADTINLFMNTLKIMHTSKKTIKKLIDAGIISNRADIFEIKNKKDAFVSIEGLGEKAFNTLVNEIEKASPTFDQFISSLGISGVSTQNAKVLAREFKNIDNLIAASVEELVAIEGFGVVTASNIAKYIDKHEDEIKVLSSLVEIQEVEEINNDSSISGKVFAVTGSVNHFNNRKELQKVIELNGGKVSGVSSKTDYLITNDTNSGSSKNKKARELGVTIITEDEFIKMIL